MADEHKERTASDLEPLEESLQRLEPVPEEIEGLREQIDLIATVAMRSEFWSGPLPSDERMMGYKQVSPEIIPAIIADFERNSIALIEAQRHQQELEKRKLDIEAREQEGRLSGDQSDIDFRVSSGKVLWSLSGVLAIALLLAVWKFFENPGSSGVFVVFILAGLMCAALVVIGGKGRISQIESDTQLGSLSWVAKALSRDNHDNGATGEKPVGGRALASPDED